MKPKKTIIYIGNNQFHYSSELIERQRGRLVI